MVPAESSKAKMNPDELAQEKAMKSQPFARSLGMFHGGFALVQLHKDIECCIQLPEKMDDN